MTTGRINQVTTFRSAFAAIIYSRVTSTRFRDAEFIITFRVKDPSQLDGRDQECRTSNPQMASPHFPFSHVPSEISFSPSWETKGSPTYDEDYRRPTTDMAEPRVASCIRFDHRQATHLLRRRSSMSHKDSMRL